ncbi:MAG: hypothetical protein JJ992_23960, partial [Planctomycetes bacterium]|nr:hypothetical protein [Planctomycetota bacterium]
MVPIFAIIHFAAYWLRFDDLLYGKLWALFTGTVFTAVAIKLLVFGYFRVYHGWGRYVTFHDLVSLVKATWCGGATASSRA